MGVEHGYIQYDGYIKIRPGAFVLRLDTLEPYFKIIDQVV